MELNREVFNILNVAGDEGKYAINNVCVEARDGKNIAVATNGRSMIKYESDKDEKRPDQAQILVNIDTCKRALKIGLKGRPLTITPEKIESYGDSIALPKPENPKDAPPIYPKYEQILAAQKECTHYEFTFDAVLMRDLLESLIKIHGPDVKGCKKTIVSMQFQADNKRAAMIVLERSGERSTGVIMPDRKE